MKLSVFERLLLRNIVPQIQGWNFGHMREARQLLEGLFTPEEEKILEITLDDDGKTVNWRLQDDDGNEIPQDKEISISEGLSIKIRKFFQDLQAKEQLNWEHYTLCEKLGLE